MIWTYKYTALGRDENGKLVEAKNQHRIKRFLWDCLDNFILDPLGNFVTNHPIWTRIIAAIIGIAIGSALGVWTATQQLSVPLWLLWRL